jgi:hypothetical protein
LPLFGTGPFKLVVSSFGTAAYRVVVNPASFTRFANVLWVDERDAGFSYATKATGSDCTYDYLADAVDYVRVVLEFVELHPRLAGARLGIVGESYGGVRASAMVYALAHAADPALGVFGIADLATRWLGLAPTRASIAERVMGVVYIQPMVFGQEQLDAQAAEVQAMRGTDPGVDVFDVRQKITPLPAGAPPPPSLAQLAIRDHGLELFGVDLAQTPGLAPKDRVGAARVSELAPQMNSPELDDALTARLGALGNGDRYYDEYATRCSVDFIGHPVNPGWFLETLETSPIFLTDAHYDSAIRSHVIFDLLAKRGYAIDATSRPGYRIVSNGGAPVAVRFAPYESGHMVPATAADAFSADLRDWLTHRAP